MRMKFFSRIIFLLLTAVLFVPVFAVFASADVGTFAGGETISSLDFEEIPVTTTSGPAGLQLGTNIKYGALTTGSTPDGNKYYKFFSDPTNCGSVKTDPFGGFYFSGRNASKTDGRLDNHSYFTVDFDLMTESHFPTGLPVFLCSRNDNGGLTQSNSTYIRLRERADGTIYVQDSTGKLTRDVGGAHDWFHVTFVVTVDHSAGTNYAKSSAHVYLDGEYFTTYSSIVSSAATYFDTVRWGVPTDKIYDDVTICFDNVLIRGYALNYTGDIATVAATAPLSLEGHADTVYATDYEAPQNYKAAVGEQMFVSAEEAFAAAQSGDTVRLFGNMEEPVTIEKSIVLQTNGYVPLYETDLKTATLAQENGELVAFSEYDPEVTVTFRLYDAVIGKTFAWGEPIAIPESFRTQITDGKTLYDFSHFSFDGKIFTDVSSGALGVVTPSDFGRSLTASAEYTSSPIRFTAQIGEDSVPYTDFSSLPALLRESADLSLVLYEDLSVPSGILLPVRHTLAIDLAGCSVSAEEDSPAFLLSAGSSLTLTNSAEEEGSVVADLVAFYLAGGASLKIASPAIRVAAPRAVDGVFSSSTVVLDGCRIASGEEALRLFGAKAVLSDLQLPENARVVLHGKYAEAIVDEIVSERLVLRAGAKIADPTDAADPIDAADSDLPDPVAVDPVPAAAPHPAVFLPPKSGEKKKFFAA